VNNFALLILKVTSAPTSTLRDAGRAGSCVPAPFWQHWDLSGHTSQVDGEAVPQGVQRDALVELRHLRGSVTGRLSWRVIMGCAGSRPGNSQPRGRAPSTGAHQIEQARRQHHPMVLAAFALLHPDEGLERVRRTTGHENRPGSHSRRRGFSTPTPSLRSGLPASPEGVPVPLPPRPNHQRSGSG
jgi:hypothetical protein